jgi:PAS domain S-box-containing protein
MQEKRLAEILNHRVISVSPSTPVDEAMLVMRRNNISCVPVIDGNDPVGILTERNVVSYSAGQKPDFAVRQVRELMSSPVVTADMDTEISAAYNLIVTNEIRHLLVVNHENRAVGMVTQSNIIENLGYEYFVEMRELSQITTKIVLTISGDSTLAEAISLMADKSISCIIVARDNCPVGILTERDVTQYLVDHRDADSLAIKEIMSTPVQTTTLDTPVIQAAEIMQKKKIRRLVIVDHEGMIIGLITQSDIIRGLESRYIAQLKSFVKEKDLAVDRAIRELEESNVFLDGILCSPIELGIASMNLKGRITYFNPTAERVLDCPAADVVGMDVREIHRRQNVDLVRFDKVIAAITSEKSHPFTFERERASGKQFIQARVTGVWDKKGRLAGYVLMVRDITEYKHNEDELRRTNEELKDFIRVVSHDLKNPLVAIQGFSQRLNKNYSDKIGKRGRDYLEHICSSAHRMELLVSDLLSLTKLGRVVFSFRNVSVRNILDKIIPTLQDRLEEKGITIEVAANLPAIQCDEEKICQVFDNLLVNAIKYMGRKEEAAIKVGYNDKGKYHQFYVKDNGIGIEPEHHSRIFGKYQRGQDVEDQDGTGLGLAIVEKIVSSHGGRVWVESEKGMGATFYFTLAKSILL